MPKDNALPVPHSDQGRSLTLYELTGAYEALSRLADLSPSVVLPNGDVVEGTNDEQIIAALEAIEGEVKDKAEALGMVIKQKEVEAEFDEFVAARYEKEVDRFKARAKTKRNNAKRIEQWLKDGLSRMGDDTQRVTGTTLSLTLAKRPENDLLEVVDESKIPNEFKMATIKIRRSDVPDDLVLFIKEVTVDKQGINAHFKQTGVAPSGTQIVPGRRNLLIR